MNAVIRHAWTLASALLFAAFVALVVRAAPPQNAPSDKEAPNDSNEPSASKVLTTEQWSKVDRANKRAIKWLLTQQQADGSFTTMDTAQPAVTSLVAMSLLSAGRDPADSDSRAVLEKACRYILSCQRDDGLLALVAPNGPCESFTSSHTAHYNHAIAGICLGELSGSFDADLNARVLKAIEKALDFTLTNQKRVVRFPDDRGGWRYATENYNVDSDVLVTAWHIMFLRSAKNAGFPVPQQAVDDAYKYVMRCYNAQEGTFAYGLRGHEAAQYSTSITGAAVLSFTLAGKGDDPAIQSAGRWLLRHQIPSFRGQDVRGDAPYFYGVFYGSQASFQLGGETWRRYYPPVALQLVDNQLDDGSWEVETDRGQMAGRVYTTALAVMTLTIADQLLPIYQR